MPKVSKEKVLRSVDEHFHAELTGIDYVKKTIPAIELLTWNRLDLAFKLIFLEMSKYDLQFSKDIYAEHLRALSFGKFSEPGDDNKNNLDGYLESFVHTFQSIKNYGFDENESLVPLSRNSSIANGAHRVASAIYLNKKVACVELDTNDHVYDYKFFYERNVPSKDIDFAVTKFIDYASNVYIAFIWPTAEGKDKEIETIIPNILYRKSIKLNFNGAHNLLSQIYHGEKWLGSLENDFQGSQGKLVECFKTFDPVRVVAFQASNLDEVLAIKERIRAAFNVGKHSIHITDTKDEAVRVAKVVFNENSIHFLNYAKPNKFPDLYHKLDVFSVFLKNNSISEADALLDSGVVLSLYGLRKSNDVDYLISTNESVINLNSEFEHHDDELEYHGEDKLELIYNPRFHFHFNDLKFVSFTQLYKMKSNRGGEKDNNDCKMMEALIENDKFKGIISAFKQKLYYTKARSRQLIINFIKFIGFYDKAKSIYNNVKKKNG